MDNSIKYLSQLADLQKQIVATITQQIKEIVAFYGPYDFANGDRITPGGNFWYRIIDDKVEIKTRTWLYWEPIEGLCSSNIYALAQDCDLFIPAHYNILKESL